MLLERSCGPRVRSGPGAVASPDMSEYAHTAAGVSDPTATPTAEAVAQLLDVVATHDVDHALSGIEDAIARLRAGAEEAAEAREILRNTPAPVLREAMRLRAARTGTTR